MAFAFVLRSSIGKTSSPQLALPEKALLTGLPNQLRLLQQIALDRLARTTNIYFSQSGVWEVQNQGADRFVSGDTPPPQFAFGFPLFPHVVVSRELITSPIHEVPAS